MTPLQFMNECASAPVMPIGPFKKLLMIRIFFEAYLCKFKPIFRPKCQFEPSFEDFFPVNTVVLDMDFTQGFNGRFLR